MWRQLGDWLNQISGLTRLDATDWLIIILYFGIALVVGVMLSRRASRDTSEYFLSGRRMPWWLLGLSMVATTFSSDTPNLVTDMTRQHGVAGNWQWWAFLLTGMLTVFIYAQLWRRSGVTTDIEFYELRYSGKIAAFLRGFRAIYLGIFFNVLVMAAVTLAAIKIGGVMLGLSPLQSILVASTVTVIYCVLGGLTGVVFTDFILFTIAMVGSIAAAIVALQHPEVGGLSGLLAHEVLREKLSLFPSFRDTDLLLSVFLIPLTIQWWSVWYPGSEPGGGGYIAQRMLAAKNEGHALGATLFFNVAHYALRPWPWILVALCSLVVFPDLESLARAFPHIDRQVLQHDLAYPAMLTFLPHGLLGLVLASLIAAYMSTISTHLNWGASYVVNDFYKRFLRPQATEKELVRVGQVTTLLLMVLTAVLALFLSNALQAFHIMLQVGAGTGLLFILRWFWWRINALSELTAMIVSFSVAIYFQFFCPESFIPAVQEAVRQAVLAWAQAWGLPVRIEVGMSAEAIRMVCGVAITTVAWLAVTFLSRPTDLETLARFCRLTRPGGPGWKKIVARLESQGVEGPLTDPVWSVPQGILCIVLGCGLVYGALFGTGYWLYGNYLPAIVLTAVAISSAILLLFASRRLIASRAAGAE